MGNAEYMGSAVQSSPLTSTLTMRAFLTVFLAVAVCGEADPYTIGQVLTGRTAGGVITGVTYPGVGAVAGFPYTAVHHGVVGYSHPYVYGKREAEAEPEPYTVGQIAAGHHIANAAAEGRLHNVGVITNAAVHPVAPVVHHAAVVAPTALGHAVAVTGYGHVTHSSNVGVCTNVAGVQVPC